MFSELMPLIQHRPLTLTVVAIGETKIRVNVIPNPTDKDKAANKEIGHSHSKEVASIPESAISALTTPLSLTGTPEEIDALLPKSLAEFTEAHVGLQNTLDTAAAAIKKAVTEINERDRLKREQDKAKNKKPDAGKSDETKVAAAKEGGLPSLFTAPVPNAVSANDPAATTTKES